MTDFRIWGRIEQIDPEQFVVIVSAIGERSGLVDVPLIGRYVAPTREVALAVRSVMIRETGAQLVARGDRVVDIEED